MSPCEWEHRQFCKMSNNVCYDDRLKTVTRPDVCGDVMAHIDTELICDGYISNKIAESDLLALNNLIHLI